MSDNTVTTIDGRTVSVTIEAEPTPALVITVDGGEPIRLPKSQALDLDVIIGRAVLSVPGAPYVSRNRFR